MAIFIHFAGRAVFGGQRLAYRPALDAGLIGRRDFIVFSLEPYGFLGPRHFDDLEQLLVDITIVQIGFRAIHRRAGDVIMLAENIRPAVLITACKPGDEATLGEVVENGDFLGDA